MFVCIVIYVRVRVSVSICVCIYVCMYVCMHVYICAGTQMRILLGHEGEVWCVTWSADGELLASGGSDKCVRLWDPRSGCMCRCMSVHVCACVSL